MNGGTPAYNGAMNPFQALVQRTVFSVLMTSLLTGAGLLLFPGSDRTVMTWFVRILALTPVAWVGSWVLGPACTWAVGQLFSRPRRGRHD